MLETCVIAMRMSFPGENPKTEEMKKDFSIDFGFPAIKSTKLIESWKIEARIFFSQYRFSPIRLSFLLFVPAITRSTPIVTP